MQVICPQSTLYQNVHVNVSSICSYHILVDDKANILPCNKTLSFD